MKLSWKKMGGVEVEENTFLTRTLARETESLKKSWQQSWGHGMRGGVRMSGLSASGARAQEEWGSVRCCCRPTRTLHAREMKWFSTVM
jgi:hypothetical protein